MRLREIVSRIRTQLVKILRRSVYIAYYVKDTDFQKLYRYQQWVKQNYGQGRTGQTISMIQSCYRYNCSFVDYYHFEFFRKTHSERSAYAGTGHMYEYQLLQNPHFARPQLENKIKFLKNASQWVQREWAEVDDLEALRNVIVNSGPKLVIKNSTEQAGRAVKVIDSCQDPLKLAEFMRQNGFDLAEQYVEQHPALTALAPGSLNTLRVITEVGSGRFRLLGVRLRLGAGNDIDNFSQGGLVCCVDPENGVVTTNAYSMDFTKPPHQSHPVSGQPIKGFIIPNWSQVCEQIQLIADKFSDCKSVGWDLAIKEKGIELIEGNHNWGLNTWQIPEQKGLRALLAYPFGEH